MNLLSPFLRRKKAAYFRDLAVSSTPLKNRAKPNDTYHCKKINVGQISKDQKRKPTQDHPPPAALLKQTASSARRAFERNADREPIRRLHHNLRSLFTAGRLYLDDELRLRFVSGPGRSGNQIHVVIDPKRVKPYVSLNPLFF
jgi:hypothetical protein